MVGGRSGDNRLLFVRSRDNVAFNVSDGLAANAEFQTRKELVARAHDCARKRGLPVNLIAVDHYDQGDLTDGVVELNRERIEAAR